MVWWKKLMDATAQFASSNGLKTLEQTLSGKLLTQLQSMANTILGSGTARKILAPLWDVASLKFVQGAGNQVHVFLNSGGISDVSTFVRIEYQYLKNTGTQIVFHLVDGGK